MNGTDRWNARYLSGETGAAEPHRLVVEAGGLIRPGLALDLACGAGRNARYLAQRGWRVSAVDGSPAALQLAAGPRVQRILADLERNGLPFHDSLFDLIIIINFLHRPLFVEALRVARPGAIIAAAIRTSGNHSLPPGALREFFPGCRIEAERDGEIIATRLT